MLFASALSSSTAIVGYLALFAVLGFGFIFVNLLVGYFLRPHDPHEEKQEIYECGEPTIGSSFVQFDLRFYVIALVFIIFDVEVAFLFPWATVFGKATKLMHTKVELVQIVDGETTLSPIVKDTYRELGVADPILPTGIPATDLEAAVRRPGSVNPSGEGAKKYGLATLALVEGAIFFAVLFVGFAYIWRIGSLDWVKSIRTQNEIRRRAKPVTPPRESKPQGSVLSA